MSNLLAVILARSNSKRIKNKNIEIFHGKPMIYWSIRACQKTGLFKKIIVSTNSSKIANIAKKYGANVPFLRSKKNSGDNIPTIKVVHEVFKKVKKIHPDRYSAACILYASTPFIYYKDLIRAYKLLMKSKFNCILPVVKQDKRISRSFFRDKNSKLKMLFPKLKNTRTQDLRELYLDAGQWIFMKFLKFPSKKKYLIGKKTGSLEIPSYRCIDIDDYDDLQIAREKFIKFKKNI